MANTTNLANNAVCVFAGEGEGGGGGGKLAELVSGTREGWPVHKTEHI